MLEGVGLQVAGVERLVRDDEIRELEDLELIALLGEHRLDLLDDLGMRAGCHADADHLLGERAASGQGEGGGRSEQAATGEETRHLVFQS